MIRFSQIPDSEHVKRAILHAYSKNRLAQSILFTNQDGGAGIGIALATAQYIACSNKTEQDSCGSCISCRQFSSGNYPDIHLFYPFVKSSKENIETSQDLRGKFFHELQKSIFLTKARWQNTLATGNRQFIIPVTEAEYIIKTTQTKASKDKPRIIIIWLPEYLNSQAANKLLKTLEEPGANSYFILVSIHAERLLKTVKSRCISFKIPPSSQSEIVKYLKSLNINPNDAERIVLEADSSFGIAFDLSQTTLQSDSFGHYFIEWVRLIYSRKIDGLIDWSDSLSQLNREDLKAFIAFSTSVFKNAFSVWKGTKITPFAFADFNIERIIPHIKMSGMAAFLGILEEARRDIERNANPRIVMLSLSIQLFKYIGQT